MCCIKQLDVGDIFSINEVRFKILKSHKSNAVFLLNLDFNDDNDLVEYNSIQYLRDISKNWDWKLII
mgnify:CR=1 FL=1